MQIGTKPDEYAKEYKKEKQNGHLSSDAPCEHRVPCSHKDIQKKKKGGKQYHKTRKELVEQYTILNDVFNEKMSEYEKLYGF